MKKIYKSIRFLSLLLLLTVASSCGKSFLDLSPTTTLNNGNAFKTAQDLNNAVTGAYNILPSSNYYQMFYIILGDIRSDNSYAGSVDASASDFDMLRTLPTSSDVLYIWSELYQGIGRCNIVLEKLNEVNDPELDKNDLRQHILGQASFLRALHYFNLVKCFGGVPLELNSNSADPGKTNIQRSSDKEVYGQIVKDLEVAIANLPDYYSSSDNNTENKTRATKGAANALMAKVWAQRSDRDYSKVASYCDAVINSPAGYSLLSNYADLFDGSHYMNTESILEISYIADAPIVSNWGIGMWIAPEEGWKKYGPPSKDLVALYNSQNDMVRMNANIEFLKPIPEVTSPDENWNPCNDTSKVIPYIYKQKFLNGWASGDHTYLLRLADIKLLKAEALNETGNIGGAVALVNEIRTRVGLADISASSKEDLRNKILNERRLELAFEGHRFDDLVRMGVFVSTMNNLIEYKYTCGDGIQSDRIKINYNATPEKMLLPIPDAERSANPNLGQNPGY